MSVERFGVAALVALSTVLAGASASAQDPSSVTSANLVFDDLSLYDGNADRDNGDWRINIEDCRELMQDATSNNMTFSWVLESGAEGVYGIKVQRPGDDCDESRPERATDGTEGDCDFIRESNNIDTQTIEYVTTPKDFFEFSEADDCLSRASSIQNFDVQFIYTNPNNADDSGDSYIWYQSRVILDTSRPSEPEVNDVSAGSSVIRIRFGELEDSEIQYRAYYSTTEFSSSNDPEQLTGVSMTEDQSGSPIEIQDDSFVVGETYYVSVVAIGTTGNASELTRPLAVTIQATSDFYETYRARGGVEDGGYCAAAPARSAAGSAMLLMGALAMTRRRARRGER